MACIFFRSSTSFFHAASFSANPATSFFIDAREDFILSFFLEKSSYSRILWRKRVIPWGSMAARLQVVKTMRDNIKSSSISAMVSRTEGGAR
ncbi:hypothetical protein HanRHA438_Chr13g0610491 [Helianthus annuus]|nr:hypothetical protein HanRHA438_Chr13g0610491 [Helianthus annuus]